MLWQVVLLLVVLGTYQSECKNYQFVLAPKFIRFNHSETITVCIFGNQSNTKFTLWFQHGQKQISKTTVTVGRQESPASADMKITQADIFGEDENPKTRQIKPKEIELRVKSVFGEMSKVLRLSYKSGYLIVQTDKPLYTPRESVGVRVVAMHESLRPVDDLPVFIDIIDPRNLTVARKKAVKIESSGIYRERLELPPFPETGIWTAKATFGGKYETVGIMPFEVKEFVLPTFGVTITTESKYILESEKQVSMKVDATYVYGKKVQGSASVRVFVRNKKKADERTYLFDMERQALDNGWTRFIIRIESVVEKIGNFPAGMYLEVEASVLEIVTGKSESSVHDSLIFTDSPVYFEFSRSRHSYRPGMPYELKVDMFYANGEPARKQTFEASERMTNQTTKITDRDGRAIIKFETATTSRDDLKFEVFRGEKSAQFTVRPYKGDNQIEVEKVTTNDGKVDIRATTNIRNGTTGIMLMVVLRGTVVYSEFSKASIRANAELRPDVLEKVSPDARIIGFYVDETSDELVADAVKFDANIVCRGRELKVTVDDNKIKPGDLVSITVDGPKRAWVGFNIMDNALLLLNKENVLKHNTVLKQLQSHDMGCGVGGGVNNAEVIDATGLTVITNAKISAAAERCEGRRQRWKRSTNCAAHPDCCSEGEKYASNLYHFTTELIDDVLVPDIICYSRIRELLDDKTIKRTYKCMTEYHKHCVLTLAYLLGEDDDIGGRTILDGGNEYTQDLEQRLLKNKPIPRARTNFETSFFFAETQLALNGTANKTVAFQDSITDWTIQAISLSEKHGACVAADKTVSAFREFFIQLDLPYKATRLEHFDIEATIFNYGGNKTAYVYLEGIDGLCYGQKPGDPTDRKVVQLASNSAERVRFPMVPLKAGELPITLTAFISDERVLASDVVKKKLYVVNMTKNRDRNPDFDLLFYSVFEPSNTTLLMP